MLTFLAGGKYRRNFAAKIGVQGFKKFKVQKFKVQEENETSQRKGNHRNLVRRRGSHRQHHGSLDAARGHHRRNGAHPDRPVPPLHRHTDGRGWSTHQIPRNEAKKPAGGRDLTIRRTEADDTTEGQNWLRV